MKNIVVENICYLLEEFEYKIKKFKKREFINDWERKGS